MNIGGMVKVLTQGCFTDPLVRRRPIYLITHRECYHVQTSSRCAEQYIGVEMEISRIEERR